jgi:metal-responsive CopG/Arc/MetJ family transcriptional regulator
MESKQITITIPKVYYDKVEEIMEYSKWSRSLVIRESLKDFLAKYYDGEISG